MCVFLRATRFVLWLLKNENVEIASQRNGLRKFRTDRRIIMVNEKIENVKTKNSINSVNFPGDLIHQSFTSRPLIRHREIFSIIHTFVAVNRVYEILL